MTVKELTELVEEAKQLLIKDFTSTYKTSPNKKELINYVKKLYKNGEEETILNDLFLDDIDCPSDFYKLLLIFAAE
jgi:sulfur relay (sulfurtransferase) DsrC/TusE family protein